MSTPLFVDQFAKWVAFERYMGFKEPPEETIIKPIERHADEGISCNRTYHFLYIFDFTR